MVFFLILSIIRLFPLEDHQGTSQELGRGSSRPLGRGIYSYESKDAETLSD